MTTEQVPADRSEGDAIQIRMADIYQPHSGQREAHESPAKVKVLEIGRRWGKSRFALNELIGCYAQLLEVPSASGLVPPFHAWIVGPTERQLMQVWNELMSFIPAELLADAKQDDRTVFLKGTQNRPWGLIEVKSAYDPEGLQTAGLDFLWVTEAQDIQDAAFYKLLPTLRSPDRAGRAVYEGIPPLTQDHWFRKQFAAAQDRDDMFSLKASTFDNPMLTDEHKAEIEGDREVLPEAVWKRLYMAEFNEDAGYFKNISDCIAGDLLDEPLPATQYVGGMDLGRKADQTVLVIMDAAERKVVYHKAFDAGTNWVTQREVAAAELKRFDTQRVIIDSTGLGDVFFQELVEMGVPAEEFIFTAPNRDALLTGLGVSLERETVHFPHIPMLIRQLRAFQYRKVGGRVRPEAPPGEHDDEVFALALALTACQDAPSVNSSPWRRPLGISYVPTQEQADKGETIGRRQQMMRDRNGRKMEERADAAGIRY